MARKSVGYAGRGLDVCGTVKGGYMKIIREGNLDYLKHSVRFECNYCHTIFKAEKGEYTSDSKYNETYYVAECPLCHNKTYSDERKRGIMKKLFVSVPKQDMHVQSVRAIIQKMKKIAECFEGEELELLNSEPTDISPKNCNVYIWDLAKNIELMAQADIFIGFFESYDWRECQSERAIATAYGIKMYTLPSSYVIDYYESLVNSVRPVNCEGISPNKCTVA